MPRGSQARSGSNPRHLHQPPKPESITTTQPPAGRKLDTSRRLYNRQPGGTATHASPKAVPPAGHTAGHHLHKPSPQASTTGSKSTRAGDTRPGGTCKDCKAEQHPAPAQATASTQTSGKKRKSPHPLKGGQTRQRRSTPPDYRRTAQANGERTKNQEENESEEQQKQKNYLHKKLFLKKIGKETEKKGRK